MQDFLDYLGTLILVPILTIIGGVIISFLIKMPVLFKIVIAIVIFVFLTYLIPYFVRAFIWSLLPSYIITMALVKYNLIPWLEPMEVGLFPPLKEALGCMLILTGIILLIRREAWLKDDRATGDPCVPFARNRYNNKDGQYSSHQPTMAKAKSKQRPIGFGRW